MTIFASTFQLRLSWHLVWWNSSVNSLNRGKVLPLYCKDGDKSQELSTGTLVKVYHLVAAWMGGELKDRVPLAGSATAAHIHMGKGDMPFLVMLTFSVSMYKYKVVVKWHHPLSGSFRWRKQASLASNFFVCVCWNLRVWIFLMLRLEYLERYKKKKLPGTKPLAHFLSLKPDLT